MKQKTKSSIRDFTITCMILLAALCAALVVGQLFRADSVTPVIFVLAVFLISMLTNGYFWGIVSGLGTVLAVNFAFTDPFYAFDFSLAENVVSALVMGIVTVATCTLTQKVKRHEMLRAEFDREKIRSNLLRGVSHDLRTPLTTIYGASSTIADHYDVLTDEQKLRMLRGIQEDSQWLIRMVENLLSITRIGNENVKITKTSVVVEEVAGAAVQKFQKRYPDWKAEMEIPREFITISADPMLIQQVLVNFLENAVQHAQGMQKLKLKVVTRGKRVIFEVEDDGCGIPDQQLRRLFTGDVSEHGRCPDGSRNMGIGLSVCATIIHAHGGEVYAQPGPHGGMRFGFELDMEEEDE